MGMWYYVKSMTNLELYEFLSDYFFGNKHFNILKHDFDKVCDLMDKTLDCYLNLLTLDDKKEIYDIGTQIYLEEIEQSK
jgi:hypothetical protein